MAKVKTQFVCQSCGSAAPKWLGRCPDCGAWNSYQEETCAAEPAAARGWSGQAAATHPVRLAEIEAATGHPIPIGIGELDRVLGGGLIPGSMVLLGGDPGIGKSTIALQALAHLAGNGHRGLYATGEESAAQVKRRALRLGVDPEQSVFILTENTVDAVARAIQDLNPTICIIDSIQTIYSSALTSAPGTVSQLREVTTQLLYLTKARPMATLLIGHVTKDGTLAGPKVLEHMVDTVLYFEGERGHQYRLLRAVKNRFGSTNELGVFEMTGEGLREVSNPSELFLAERPAHAAGSVVIAPLEGTRPMLVELQALVSHSGLANPRRTVIGVEGARVGLLIAVLERITGLALHDQDVFVNVAGGLKIAEPASDLGIVTAIASSFRNRPVPERTVVIGEVGLTGEVRAVVGLETRMTEAHKLGFRRAIVPKGQAGIKGPKGMELTTAGNVAEALECLS
ncbi:MAG: DNA repair protein RadA [Deltaproteobacteria bacterium]|nr:DNA repair protein RadA [Deltaproteobacteria bacterium]